MELNMDSIKLMQSPLAKSKCNKIVSLLHFGAVKKKVIVVARTAGCCCLRCKCCCSCCCCCWICYSWNLLLLLLLRLKLNLKMLLAVCIFALWPNRQLLLLCQAAPSASSLAATAASTAATNESAWPPMRHYDIWNGDLKANDIDHHQLEMNMQMEFESEELLQDAYGSNDSDSNSGSHSNDSRNSRNGRVIHLFPVPVDGECLSDDGRRLGNCFNAYECRQKGGQARGECAMGFGVCCVFVASCNETITNNITYIVSPEFPSFLPNNFTSCQIKVKTMSDDISQLRIDFYHFSMGQPNRRTGVCEGDIFDINGGPSGSFSLCGQNSGQHLYYDVGVRSLPRQSPLYGSLRPTNGPGGNRSNQVDQQIEIKLNVSKRFLPIRLWEMRVSQIPFNQRAPAGCLQYHTGLEGIMQTFNFADNGRHLANQHYRICVRQETDMCSIMYQPCDEQSFRIGGGNAFMSSQSAEATSSSSVAAVQQMGPTMVAATTAAPATTPAAATTAQTVSSTLATSTTMNTTVAPVRVTTNATTVAPEDDDEDEDEDDDNEAAAAEDDAYNDDDEEPSSSSSSSTTAMTTPNPVRSSTATSESTAAAEEEASSTTTAAPANDDEEEEEGSGGEDNSGVFNFFGGGWNSATTAAPPNVSRRPRPVASGGNSGFDFLGFLRSAFDLRLRRRRRRRQLEARQFFSTCSDRITMPCIIEDFIGTGLGPLPGCEPVHCGSQFCSSGVWPCRIESTVTPFYIGVHFGNGETTMGKGTAEENIGACLRYTQVQCI